MRKPSNHRSTRRGLLALISCAALGAPTAALADFQGAASWQAVTAGGTPMKISSGVIRKPPPTPNNPESIPIIPPIPRIRKMFTEISAMGR